MTEPYYNVSWGEGIPGVLNYTNSLVDGWLVNLFLIFTFIVMTYVGSKSEWKITNVVATSCFVTFVAAMIFSLMVEVNTILLFVLGIGLGVSVFIMILESKK